MSRAKYELEKQFIEDLNDNRDEILQSKNPEDLIHEKVDAHIPVYTYQLLEIALDDIWLAVEIPDIMAFDGNTNAVNAIAGNLYEDLLEGGYKWFEEQKQKDSN